MSSQATSKSNRYFIVMVMVFAAFFLSFSYAQAKTRETRLADTVGTYGGDPANGYAVSTAQGGQGRQGGAGAAGGGCGGGCCGGGSSTPIEKETTVEGGVQKIDVDTSQGTFDPNTIKAKAGVPLEITFSQAPGGCLSGVYFPDFNINEDLTAGPKTVKLPALEKGEYAFYCQMQMISAKVVVE